MAMHKAARCRNTLHYSKIRPLCPGKEVAHVNVFVDDTRTPPAGYRWARTAEQAVQYLRTGNVNLLSLDYNLGTPPITGSTIVHYMIDNNIYPQQIVIHSSSPAGRRRMLRLLLAHKPESVTVRVRPLRQARD